MYEQYDHTVRTGNVNTNDPSDATIVRLKNSERSLAVTVDCNSAYVYADPYKGAMIAVSEAARNIRCSGGIPLGVTNCLNFGNPHNPEVDRKSTRLNSSHGYISYAVFCLKKKK